MNELSCKPDRIPNPARNLTMPIAVIALLAAGAWFFHMGVGIVMCVKVLFCIGGAVLVARGHRTSGASLFLFGTATFLPLLAGIFASNRAYEILRADVCERSSEEGQASGVVQRIFSKPWTSAKASAWLLPLLTYLGTVVHILLRMVEGRGAPVGLWLTLLVLADLGMSALHLAWNWKSIRDNYVPLITVSEAKMVRRSALYQASFTISLPHVVSIEKVRNDEWAVVVDDVYERTIKLDLFPLSVEDQQKVIGTISKASLARLD